MLCKSLAIRHFLVICLFKNCANDNTFIYPQNRLGETCFIKSFLKKPTSRVIGPVSSILDSRNIREPSFKYRYTILDQSYKKEAPVKKDLVWAILLKSNRRLKFYYFLCITCSNNFHNLRLCIIFLINASLCPPNFANFSCVIVKVITFLALSLICTLILHVLK